MADITLAPGVTGEALELAELDFGSDDPHAGVDDGRRQLCAWTEDLCTETPTHFIEHAPHRDGEVHTQRLCARHWVVTLAHIREVDLPHCGCALPDHVRATGSLVAPVWRAPED